MRSQSDTARGIDRPAVATNSDVTGTETGHGSHGSGGSIGNPLGMNQGDCRTKTSASPCNGCLMRLGSDVHEFRECGRCKHTEDKDDYNQFDQGKTRLLPFHFQLLSIKEVGAGDTKPGQTDVETANVPFIDKR